MQGDQSTVAAAGEEAVLLLLGCYCCQQTSSRLPQLATHGVEGVSTQVNELGVGLDLQQGMKAAENGSWPSQCHHLSAVTSAGPTSAMSVPSCSEMILQTSTSTSLLSCSAKPTPVSKGRPSRAQSSYTLPISLLTTAKVMTLRRTGAAMGATLGACMDTMQRQVRKRYGSESGQGQLMLPRASIHVSRIIKAQTKLKDVRAAAIRQS